MMISLVIPVYNENESVARLHQEIADVAGRADLALEMVFVDDGSTDGSWEVITDLALRDARVRGIRFRRNFGKAAALSAGFRAARGDIVFTLDADLQDDPAEIPFFLSALADDLDVVSGWKRTRHDPWHKVWPSRVFNFLVSWLTGVRLHDHNCGMKCYRAEVLREISLYGERHRFIPVLAAARGFKVHELPIHHRPRQFGRSKYGFRRFVKGFLDLVTIKFVTGFGQRPQHVLGTIALLCFVGGGMGLAYLALTWLIHLGGLADYVPLTQRPLLTYSVSALLLGAQMLSVGLLSELLTACHSREADTYSVADKAPALKCEEKNGKPTRRGPAGEAAIWHPAAEGLWPPHADGSFQGDSRDVGRQQPLRATER
jgi:glycosyltransferase involved in cell wall biosynthesis